MEYFILFKNREFNSNSFSSIMQIIFKYLFSRELYGCLLTQLNNFMRWKFLVNETLLRLYVATRIYPQKWIIVRYVVNYVIVKCSLINEINHCDMRMIFISNLYSLIVFFRINFLQFIYYSICKYPILLYLENKRVGDFLCSVHWVYCSCEV